ncbi:MAG TPA: thioredoxin-like domain-containing protein [Terrimicrobiaceae bacterium]
MNLPFRAAFRPTLSPWLLSLVIFGLPVLNAQEPLTIDLLVANRALWPREVTVKVAHEVPLLVNGKLSGSMQVPAGRNYPIKFIEAEKIGVDALGSSLTFSPADTDILARAETVRARQEALANARVAATPVVKQSPSLTLPSPTPTAATSKLADKLIGDLVFYNGRTLERFDASSLKDKKYLAIYFSASWCGPCREFTPRLVQWYNEQKAQLSEFEVILVSRDRTKQDMVEYMKKDSMPWPALSFARGNQRSSPVEKYAGPAIPCLVVVDAEGKVISDSYKGEEYLGPRKVLKDLEHLLAAQ